MHTQIPSAQGVLEIDDRPENGWRRRLYIIIFEADTRAGRAFDLILLALILTSVLVVMIDSVETINANWGGSCACSSGCSPPFLASNTSCA